MLRYRTQGLLAAGLGLLLTGCFSDPDLKTGLRPEGSPEVLTVLATDANGLDAPAFCKYIGGQLDPKGPREVVDLAVTGAPYEICPATEAEFTANGPAQLDPTISEETGLPVWNIRVMFDELLDGAVETLVDGADDSRECFDNSTACAACTVNSDTCKGRLDTTLPFELSCGGMAIPYDGYYYPNGNKDSSPVGPALILQPRALAPTGQDCQLTIKPSVVKDKQGVSVDIGLNLNQFTIAVMELDVVETDPLDAEAVAERSVLAPDGVVTFVFNSLLDAATVSVTDVTLTNLDTNLPVVADVTVTDNVIEVAGAVALPVGNYAAKITTGAVIDDVVGGTRTFGEIQVRFVVE